MTILARESCDITDQGQSLQLLLSTILSCASYNLSARRPQKRLENHGFDILATSDGFEANLRLPTVF
jgi:hypothetical protein